MNHFPRLLLPIQRAALGRHLCVGLVATLSAISALSAADAPPVTKPPAETPPAVKPGDKPAEKPIEDKPVIDGPVFVPESQFAVPEGLEVTLWASTPLLRKPTNIDIDQYGRIWVAEGVNYRSKAGRRKEGDQIVVLEDSTGSGKADKSHVFVQEENLIAPLGVAVIDNQIVVSQPPDLIVYTDVDRNGVFDPKIDKREVLLTGFNGRNHDHSLHSLTAGPDGLWYFNQGNTGMMFTDKSGKTFRVGSHYNQSKAAFDPATIAGQASDDGHVYVGGATVRMNPDGTNAQIIGYNYRNSFEQAINSLGDIFQNDNDDPPACRVTAVMEYGNAGFNSPDGKRSWNADKRPGQTTQVAEWRQDDPGTMPAGDVYGGGSPTGIVFYENGALGDKWRGLLLSCEAGRNVIFGYQPKPDGAGFKLERMDFLTSNQEKQFAGSDFTGGKPNDELKTKFRPSDVAVGPDGAIYVADWFDPRVGGHQTMDKSWSGNIYRIAPKGFKPQIPKLDLATIPGQIEALKSPAINVRNLGFTRLKAQGDAAVPALAALLKDENPYFAARATWLLAQMGAKGAAEVVALLDSKDAAVRTVAYRALRRANHEVPAMAARMAKDPSPAVRREVALTMRNLPAADSVAILVEVAKGFDGTDRAYLNAVGIGAQGKENEVWDAIAKTAGAPETWSDAVAWTAWRLSSPAAVPGFKARALSAQLSAPQRKLMMDALAFVKTAEASTAMVDLAEAKDFPMRSQAMWWLFNRMNNDWKEFGVGQALKTRGLYDPETIKLVPVLSPEPPPGPSKLVIEDIQKLAGDAARGKAAVSVCYTCHQIGKQGADFGPDLTMFAKTQPSEVVLNSIINPSSDIALGFDGSELTTNDGVVIFGIVVVNGDPVIIKSMGGIVQTVPKNKIKSLTKMKRSLMLSADALGLSGQTLADILAYLKSKDL